MKPVYQLTKLQEGMLYHHLEGSSNGVDIEQISVRIRHTLSVDAFIRSWYTLISRHAVLRSGFVWNSSGEPYQEIAESPEIPFNLLNWKDLSVNEAELQFNRLIDLDRQQNFDLAESPAMRLTLASGPDNTHYCLWTFHHIILDGRSFPVLLQELFSIYDSLSRGEQPEPAKPRPAFRDYVDWLNGRDLAEDMQFWRNELSGLTPDSCLSFSNLPPSSESAEFDEIEIALPAEQTKALRDVAKQAGVSEHNVLQAAWVLLLSHYSEASDIVFGSTRACRRGGMENADDIVGLLINTVPVRVQLNDSQTLLELLQYVHARQKAIAAHQFTPLPMIQQQVADPREAGLFESLLVYEKYLLDTRLKSLGGRWLQRDVSYRGQTNFPLALIAYADQELLLRLEYDCTRFSKRLMQQFFSHYVNLLNGFPGQLDQKARALDYLTQEETHNLTNMRLPKIPQSQSVCLHHWFEKVAERYPENTAVQYESQNFTYARLNSEANRVAHHLIAEGVATNDYVGLCFERSADLIIGILAILKCGAAYVPLDPSYPQERLAYIIDDAGMSKVLSSRSVLNELPLQAAELITLDDVPALASSRNPQLQVLPSSIAYVIYTSGSTGKPKGVKVRHDNVDRLFTATEHWFHFEADDCWTLFHSSAFDFSVWEIWGALLYGGRLIVVPYWVSREPEQFYELVRKQGVTVLNQTPSAFRQFIAVDQQQQEVSLEKLRYVIFGGEALDFRSLQTWFEKHSDAQPRMVNMYGITETTVHVTYRPVSKADASLQQASLIGEPIPDLFILLLNQQMKPVPDGVTGEMYVGGKGVASGYLNREALNKERFLDNPFSPGQLLYKTGDLARRSDAGELEYLGRADFQVKVRGFRIEVGEIEAALDKHPSVTRSIVLTDKNPRGETRLLAYLSGAQVKQMSSSDWREFLSRTLPDHMIPGFFIPLEEVPLTANGKLDSKALPRPEHQASRGRSCTPPETAQEKLLVSIWSQVLDVKELGINDNYYDLGGDSILTIRIVALLQEHGYKLTPRQLFDAKTIARLAPLLQRAASTQTEQEKIIGQTQLLPAQQWFFSKRFAQAEYWNQSFLFDLAEQLDVNHLQTAIQRLMEHHDGLRASYRKKDGEWQQWLTEDANFSFAEVSLPAAATPGDTEQLIEQQCNSAQALLDLQSGPLLAAVYFHSEDAGDKLFLTLHHLLVDGVSWGILLSDLELIYKELKQFLTPALAAKTTSLAEWRKNLDDYVTGTASQKNLHYWNELSQHSYDKLFSESALPGDEQSAAVVSFTLDIKTSHALLRESSQAYNTQINDLLIAGLGIALHQWRGVTDLLLDIEGHGREDLFDNVDLSKTVGWFTSIFPLMLQVPRDAGLGTLLTDIKEQLRLVPGRGFDFLPALYLGANEALGQLPQAEILFNYMGQLDQLTSGLSLLSLSEQTPANWHGPANARTHHLEIVLWVKNDCLQCFINYDTEALSGQEAKALSDAYERALYAIIEHCTSVERTVYTPSDFPALTITQKELSQLQTRFDIEDIYPLTAMQKLFYAADQINPANGFEQWHFAIRGTLDEGRYQRAWQSAIDKHPLLRSAVIAQSGSQLAQLIVNKASLDWQFKDISSHSEEQQRSEIECIKFDDRQTHFDLGQPSLLRLRLIKISEDSYHLLWSTHHLVIDGWSWPVLFNDIKSFYSNGETEELRGSFKDYAEWLKGYNKNEAALFWKEYLHELHTPIGLHRDTSATATTVKRELSDSTSRALEEKARQAGVSVSTLFQGVWAWVLHRCTQTSNIVFGVSSAGRPAEIPDVAKIIGPFVNNMPVRIAVPPAQSLHAWLSDIQSQSLQALQFEASSLEDIQSYAGLPVNQRLFETLLVFQNYDLEKQFMQLTDEVSLRAVDVPQASSYPLTVVVSPAERISIQLYGLAGYFGEDELQNLLDHVCSTAHLFATADQLHELNDASWTCTLRTAKPVSIIETVPDDNKLDDHRHDEVERQVAEIWANAFGVSQVPHDASFFSMGGQSLQLVSLHAEIQERLNREFPITIFFKHPSVSALSRYLRTGPAVAATSSSRMQQRKLQRKKNILRKRQQRRAK